MTLLSLMQSTGTVPFFETAYKDLGLFFKEISLRSTVISEYARAILALIAYGQRLKEYKIGY